MNVSLLMYRMQEQIKIFQMVQQKIDSGEIPVHMLQVCMHILSTVKPLAICHVMYVPNVMHTLRHT